MFPSASQAHEYTPSSSMTQVISHNTEGTLTSGTPVSSGDLGTPVLPSIGTSAPQQPVTPVEAFMPPSGFVNVNEGAPGSSTVSIGFAAYKETSNRDPVQQPTTGSPTPHSQTSSFVSYKVTTTGGAAPQSTTQGRRPYSRRYTVPLRRANYGVRRPSASWMFQPHRRVNNNAAAKTTGIKSYRFAKQPAGFEASYIVKSFNGYSMGTLVHSKTTYTPLTYPHTQIKRGVKSM